MKYQKADLEAALGERFGAFKLLGSGGEGAVYGVWDRVQKQDVALKLTRDTGEPGLQEKFDREYEILATTRSPRLVTVYRYGNTMLRAPDGLVYKHFWYTMEKCDTSVRRSYQQMPLAGRLDVVMQMLDGLAHLHAKNIAHRDIKPENLFLAASNRGVQMKIGDFGIATTTRFAPNSEGGYIYGSPAYLAPERWKNAGDADWRPADQYAAGVTLYELLSCGGSPLDFSVGHRIAHEQGVVRPLMVPELRGRRTREVDKVIAQMLQKAPGWRFLDLAECKRELAAALALDGVSS